MTAYHVPTQSAKLQHHQHNAKSLGSLTKRRLLMGASALALAVTFNAAVKPLPAWAVICQATGATPNATANANDGVVTTKYRLRS
jgi:hypothetical protein